MDREKTCAFTGNRSAKLPWLDDERDYRCLAAKRRIRDEVEAAVSQGYDTFLCGMANGGDTYFAQQVLSVKKNRPVRLICILPCPNQTKGWTQAQIDEYDEILTRADEVTLLSDHYSRYCMHKRNRYLVDHSSLLLTLDYTEDGGAASTRGLAVKQGVRIIDLA